MNQIKFALFVRRCLCVVPMLVSVLHAAFEFQGAGWTAASGNIQVIGGAHLERYTVNPSLMNTGMRSQLDIQVGRPFDGLELASGALRFFHHLKGRPVSEYIEYFGDDVYSELAMGSGSSWSLDSSFTVGLSIGYFRSAFSGFNARTALTLSSGLYFKLTKDIHFGSVLQHLMQATNGLELPQRFLFGLEYDAGPLLLLLSFQKEAALPLELCFGLVSSPKWGWQIACGYRDLSGSLSAGWRFKFGDYSVHYTWIHHSELPDSHGLGLELFF